MQKTTLKISLFAVLLSILASCHNEERVYDSTNMKGKHKRFDVTLGKYNKLLKSSDMDAKYAAAKKYYDKEVCHGYYEPTVYKFVEWLKNEYGIELQMTRDSQINSMYRIVDEAKLTMFTLKFTK
jgi:hypothetical protein